MKEKIELAYKAAMKAKLADRGSEAAAKRLATLKLVKAALVDAETAGKGRKELSDKDVEQVLRNLVKKREKTAAEFDRYNAADRASAERQEAAIIDEFLPKLLGEDETRALIKGIVAEQGDTANIGSVMKVVKTFDDVDKGVAARIVKELV